MTPDTGSKLIFHNLNINFQSIYINDTTHIIYYNIISYIGWIFVLY